MGKIEKKDSKPIEMGARVHYTRNKSWNTRSNKVRQVRTPGGRLHVQYVQKRAATPKSAMVTDSARLGGLRRMRPHAYKLQSKHTRRVSRAYGGVYTHSEVKNRIIRTFLTEEVKNVKKAISQTAASEAKKKRRTAKNTGGAKKRPARRPVDNN